VHRLQRLVLRSFVLCTDRCVAVAVAAQDTAKGKEDFSCGQYSGDDVQTEAILVGRPVLLVQPASAECRLEPSAKHSYMLP
jgi:hypothetical protein